MPLIGQKDWGFTMTDLNTGIDHTNASEANDSIRVIPRSKLKYDRSRNPRLAKRYEAKSLSPLVRSLANHGLQEPITGSERADGSLWVLKGHRRLAAIEMLATVGLEKDAFGPAVPPIPGFGDKIRCRVLKGLTIEGEMDLLMDHADVLALDKREKLLTAKILTRFGFTHEFIAKKVGSSRSNYSNGLARILAMPSCVEEMYLSEADDALDITQEALKPLYAAYEKDLKNGGNIKEAGPNFRDAWESFVKDGAAPKVKTMSRKDILSVAGVESDPDLRNLLQAIANGQNHDLGTALERVRLRLANFDTIGTGVQTVSEGIVSTVGDFSRVSE